MNDKPPKRTFFLFSGFFNNNAINTIVITANAQGLIASTAAAEITAGSVNFFFNLEFI